jgi:hypothetical protein
VFGLLYLLKLFKVSVCESIMKFCVIFRPIKKIIMRSVIGSSMYIMWLYWRGLHASASRNTKQEFVVASLIVCRHCSGISCL